MSRSMKNAISAVLFVICPLLLRGQSNAEYSKQIQAFDRYTDEARKAWTVPGLAVAIIKDHRIIFKKGYGRRRLDAKEQVDTQTLFACASTTKAMTAACIGMLVDEGKLNWTDPVIKHLPEFQLYDPYVTRELKIRDLLIHDSGVGNADFLWGGMNITSDEILLRMRLVKPSYSLRSSFIYQNIFYLVAGKVIEKVSGLSWGQFIKQRIFVPLEMTRTQAFLNDVSDPNRASPHMFVEGSIMSIDNTNADAIGPAGSVWSCIDDISKWSLCMLDSGKYAAGRLLHPATWLEMFKPQTIVPPNEFYPTQQIVKPNWTTYGLGWFQHDYKGHKVNFHTGSLAGMVAISAQLPDEGVGMVVFANYDHAEVRHALMYKAFDLLALGGNRDWSSEFQKLYQGIQLLSEKPKKDFEENRTPNTSPSLLPMDYAGHYSDPLFGEVDVTAKDKSLTLDVNHFATATLEHWHYDTYYGTFQKTWYGTATAVFTLNSLGKVDKLNFNGMEFTKVR